MVQQQHQGRAQQLGLGGRLRPAPRQALVQGLLARLRTGYQWRFLPPEFPKWQNVYAYWRKWSEPDEHGISVLERALKKSGWRGPRETGAQRLQRVLDRGRAEREERGHSGFQGL